MTLFTDGQIEALADALGDTDHGLTGTEIGHFLLACHILDVAPTSTKRVRLRMAFSSSQRTRADRLAVVAFVRKAVKPERWLREPERYEPFRLRLNTALAFIGQQADERGVLSDVERAGTIREAETRAQDLRTDLIRRGTHPDVLRFCRAELVADDYFHAVLEAMKSVADKLRKLTGLTEDGAALVDRALTGERPPLRISDLNDENGRREQAGFANLLKGAFGMFRNTTAHAARIHWRMTKADAEDLLSLASLVHRRLDAATTTQEAR